MKAKALYHLLQVRARKLRESASPEILENWRELQNSLRVSYQDLRYKLTWQKKERSYSLELPNKMFAFYIPGDTPSSMSVRDTKNYRTSNWEQALGVWLRIAKISGVELFVSSATNELGLTPQLEARVREYAWGVLWVPIGAAFLAWIMKGSFAALWTALIAILMIALADFFNAMEIAQHLSIGEAVIIAGGALIPLSFGIDARWVVLPLAGIVGACWAERLEGQRHWMWLLPGVLCGAGAWPLGYCALIGGVPLALSVMAISMTAPNKISLPSAVVFVGSMILSSGIGIYGRCLFPIAVPAVPIIYASAIVRLSAACGAGLFCAFLVWWTHGVMYHVLPWSAILSLAILVVTVVSEGRLQVEAETTAIWGLLVFLVLRITSTWYNAKMLKVILPIVALGTCVKNSLQGM